MVETLKKHLKTNPNLAAKLMEELMPFDIYFMIFHGSTADGDCSENSDIDLFISVDEKDASIADSTFKKMPNFDVYLVSVNRLVDFFQRNPVAVSVVKNGMILIDKCSFREIILRNGINFSALENDIKESIVMVNITSSILELSSNDTPLWGCAYSLMLRFKHLNRIKYLILNKKSSKRELISEANKFGISTQMFKQFYKFYKNAYYDQTIVPHPNKDLLFPLLEATRRYIKELEFIISDLDLPIRVKEV
jgi:predicted nucleotidyltransferase